MVDASDVILEVLDARDPLGCRCPQVCSLLCCGLIQCVTCNCYKVEKAVLDAGSNKKLILVLNKIGKVEII